MLKMVLVHAFSIFLILVLLSSSNNAANFNVVIIFQKKGNNNFNIINKNKINFNVVNQCSYTVWAAASPGGGKRLDPGKSWSFDVPAGTAGGRVWGRTNCNFDGSGRGSCASGDCNGLLVCNGYGSPPNTLAEFALNQPNNLDYYDISNVDGFNIPMEFTPTSGNCKDIKCAGTSILDECPAELKVAGGCNNPCTVYKTNEYCCTNGQVTCVPTALSKYFKDKCPDAYSYQFDDTTSLFACASGTNYKVTFCP